MNQGRGQKTSSELMSGWAPVSTVGHTQHSRPGVQPGREQGLHVAATYAELV